MLFISFPLFPIFSLRQLTTKFERCLLCPENSLFALKLCLLSLECSNHFNEVGDHTEIWKKVVLACFKDFACVPYIALMTKI